MKSYVFISGAAGGLGRAFALECAHRGYDLFITDLHAAPLAQLAAALERTYNIQVLYHPADLTDPAARSELFQVVRQAARQLWMVINVAGLDYEGAFFERERDELTRIVRLNIEGTLDVTRSLLGSRDPYKPFRIINVASLAAYTPMPVKATYAASKRFLLDFSLALREELRPLGATVTVLCPAGMPTNADCMRGIAAQGWIGQITTQNTGSVAGLTIDRALQGRAVVIPGLINQIIQVLSSLVPAGWAARLVGARWRAAQQRIPLRLDAPVALK